jgi:tRNA (guanine-N7-)-methyltransferase
MSDDPAGAAHRAGAFYGRRKGRPLKPRQADVTETLLPALRLDLAAPAPADLATLFPRPVSRVILEIGFGGGEHLLNLAATEPDTGFIGCEPFVTGMAKALSEIGHRGIDTIRLHPDDAVAVLDWLPDASLDRVYLLYPDPWPKKRHWKRRFVSADTLDRLARVTKPGAEFRFASDIDTYVDWTLRHVRDHGAFRWMAETADDWRRPWAGWPGTRYEAKALREGRPPAYLRFVRV